MTNILLGIIALELLAIFSKLDKLEVNVKIITKGLEASVMAIKKRLIELQERIVARESEAVEND
jgi:hypothetical protein